MKDIKLKKQYDEFSEEFSDLCYEQNGGSRELFYKILGKDLKNKKLLDLACGDGKDLLHYSKLGAEVYGIDMSHELVKKAKDINPKHHKNILIADFESTKHPKGKFDIVTCKYAAQTSKDVEKIFNESCRVLKRNGEFLILVVHPIRQFIERRGKNKNYFTQTVVNSVLFGGAVTVKEPTHTFKEYMSAAILKKFDLVLFDEKFDSSAEQIDGDIYPGFMVMKFKKR